MTPRHALSLLLLLLALTAGGCRPRPPALAAPDAEFTLTTAMHDGRMVFIGVGGDLEGEVNPELNVHVGETVRVVLVNGDGMPHDFALPALGAQTSLTTTAGQSTEVRFQAGQAGTFDYYCTVSGHRQAGMEGKLIIREP